MDNLKRLLHIIIVCILAVPYVAFANENNTTTTTTTITTTTIPKGEVEEVETFDGTTTTTIVEEESTTSSSTTTTTTTSSTTTTTIPETWEQSTDMVIPEDQLDLNGNETENNIDINNDWTGQYGCTDYCINLEFMQHGGESNTYEFDLPDTTIIDEEELEIEIYEVGFTIGALNNESTVTYTHTDETTQTDTIEAQQYVTAETMYEVIVYNIRETLDTFIDKFALTLNDWTLVDDISFKYIEPTTITTTTTTTTLPPPPPPPPPPTTTTTLYIVENDDGSKSEYTETEVKDGTVERDEERKENEKLFGCYMTNAQIERGDCDIPEEKQEETIIIIEDEKRDDTKEELFNDDDLVLEVDIDDEIEESKPEEEEIIPDEKIEIDIEKIEEEFKFEEEKIVIEIPEEIEIIIIKEEEILDEEIITDDTREDQPEEVGTIFEDRPNELGRDETKSIELSEEELKKEIEELEEVVVIEEIFTEEISEEELEQLSEEEILEYEEAKEEAIEQYVEELETEEVIEVLEEVNDIGLNNIAEVSEDVIEVVAQVVEEVITIAQEEELTEEQVEVVAEVLGFEETEDVEIVAEAVKTDENVAQAVDEFVERAVENKDVENYTLADATTEIAFETFVADPISVIIDVDLDNITLNNITSDMTQDQKEKAQEVIVPTLLVKIVSLAFRRFN